MYIPRAFENDDVGEQHALIARFPLAMLVATLAGRLEAAHVPCVVDPHRGERGAVRFHLARPNPLCRALDGAAEALLVFSGPEAYISPDWYLNRNLVPTWNYAAVHVYGQPAAIDDAALCRLLDDLSHAQESRLPKREWTTAKLPEQAYAQLRRAIIGFDMPIARIEGKWKMSQNRAAEDRAAAARELRALGGARRIEVADLMDPRDS